MAATNKRKGAINSIEISSADEPCVLFQSAAAASKIKPESIICYLHYVTKKYPSHIQKFAFFTPFFCADMYFHEILLLIVLKVDMMMWTSSCFGYQYGLDISPKIIRQRVAFSLRVDEVKVKKSRLLYSTVCV